MVDSTPLLFRHSTEEVLDLVQAFMETVVDVGVYHCGNVHDFEGDGALLYFAGPSEAVPAAFELRDALMVKRRARPELPLARLALDMGPLVIGVVGTRFRRSVTLVGPSINIAARILKLAPPGGIIATETVVEHAKRTDPDLASRFARLLEPQQLKGVAGGLLELYVAPA
jgi:class 3 adenylate cyclase